MALSTPIIVNVNGRIGTAIYDTNNASNLVPAVIVLFNDSTYSEVTRASCTTGASGFLPGTGV
jgi:hypothetical protein